MSFDLGLIHPEAVNILRRRSTEPLIFLFQFCRQPHQPEQLSICLLNKFVEDQDRCRHIWEKAELVKETLRECKNLLCCIGTEKHSNRVA